MSKDLKFFEGNKINNDLVLQPNSFYYESQSFGLNVISNNGKEINNLTSMFSMTDEKVDEIHNKINYGKKLVNELFQSDGIIILPEQLTQLRQGAIVSDDVTKIRKIILPSTLKLMWNYCIYRHVKLEMLDCSKLAQIPTVQSSQFICSCGDSFKIIVPAGQLTDWKAATNWSVYADRMEEAEQ